MKLSDFQALTFDCYGTLIDWETGLLTALQGLITCSPRRRTREEVLGDYGRAGAGAGTFLADDEVLRSCSPWSTSGWRRTGSAPAPWTECATFAASMKMWEPFPIPSPRSST